MNSSMFGEHSLGQSRREAEMFADRMARLCSKSDNLEAVKDLHDTCFQCYHLICRQKV